MSGSKKNCSNLLYFDSRAIDWLISSVFWGLVSDVLIHLRTTCNIGSFSCSFKSVCRSKSASRAKSLSFWIKSFVSTWGKCSKENRFLENWFIFRFCTERFVGYGVISAKIRVLTFKVEFCCFSFVNCRFFVVLFNITVVSFVKTRGTWCRANARTKLFVLIYGLPELKAIGHVLHGS